MGSGCDSRCEGWIVLRVSGLGVVWRAEGGLSGGCIPCRDRRRGRATEAGLASAAKLKAYDGPRVARGTVAMRCAASASLGIGLDFSALLLSSLPPLASSCPPGLRACPRFAPVVVCVPCICDTFRFFRLFCGAGRSRVSFLRLHFLYFSSNTVSVTCIIHRHRRTARNR